jgi:hypothetical protein
MCKPRLVERDGARFDARQEEEFAVPGFVCRSAGSNAAQRKVAWALRILLLLQVLGAAAALLQWAASFSSCRTEAFATVDVDAVHCTYRADDSWDAPTLDVVMPTYPAVAVLVVLALSAALTIVALRQVVRGYR